MSTTKPSQSDHHARPFPGLLATVRDDLRARRARRAAHKQLLAELSTYTRQSEIDDLAAMLDRYDDAQVAEIRDILSRQAAA
ncbi:MAG: hypothetical protein WAL50_14525 [Kineosporiaceae bacterium]|jgi:hypothetical protein